MHKIIYCLAISLYSIFIFAKDAEIKTGQTASKIEVDHKKFLKEFCEDYDSQKDFYQKMLKEILSNDEKRKQLALELKQKKLPGCELAIKDYMKKILSENDNAPKTEDQAFLSLALLAKIPEANEVIGREIDRGFLSHWIDLLRKSDKNTYLQALNNWVKRVAIEIRKKDDTKLLDSSLYGRLPQDGKELKYPDMVRIWTPILMSRYLTEMIEEKTKLDEEQFGYLNIIFAATTTSYRETFLDQIAKIVSNNPQAWIYSFRKEPNWVEFRLFPIMKKAGGGDIKREMVWLSNNHQNIRIKTLATNTLEAIATQQNKK